MARGWESKSVEQQQDLAASDSSRKAALTPEQAEMQRELASLRLSRARVEQQLAAAQNVRYRRMLEMEMKALDAKIEAIQTD